MHTRERVRAAFRIAAIFAFTGSLAAVAASEDAGLNEPQMYTYREIDGTPLHAYVFAPADRGKAEPANAILLVHGGGWSAGSAEWTFDAARQFAESGLVAISIQYRLSEGDVTPIEALDDVCAAFRWARENTGRLGITGCVLGYGVSAGGHLVALAATRGCSGGVGPDALLLWCPALDVAADGWFQRKLNGRASSVTYSPVEYVSGSTPPTSIVHGAEDTLTPLSGARRFCDRLIEAGGICELNAYKGLGHLLTRNLENQESEFDPDPNARADGIARHLAFLRILGLVPNE
ncbi:MAG: alpha/beta hydrolase [Acidobacteriota bacterium]